MFKFTRRPNINRPPLPGLKKKQPLAKPRLYTCEGGPFDKKQLALTDGTSIVFNIGGVRGRYECGAVSPRCIGMWLARAIQNGKFAYGGGTTVWRPFFGRTKP